MRQSETIIKDLNYLVKTYDGLNKLIVSTKNRLAHLNKDAEAKHQDEIISIERIKDQLGRRIVNDLECFPIWTDWLKYLPGIGPAIAGHLVILYYVRFVPICEACGHDLVKTEATNGQRAGFRCSECGKPAKGEGILKTRIEEKDFRNISSWWHYMGCHVVDGKKPRKKRGCVSDWSSTGRAVAFQIGEQFIKKPPQHLYRGFYDERRKKRDGTHPEATKLHRLNMARNETAKLFLAHFWEVARTLDGKEVTAPYAETIMGHTGILKPFYWEPVES